MPIGTGIIYNVGDLILSQVSGSGTSFLETKIAAATSSIVYFDSTARINSASLNSITVGTASYVSGSTSIITNLTASNISASGTSSFGMVGIGTSSPEAILQVANTGRILGVLRLQITPQTTFYDHTFAIGTDGGGAQGFIYTSGTGGTFPLNTYGELILQAGPRTGFNNGISLVTGTTSPSVKLRIAEDGNVGIGTTVPGALLEVSSSTAASLLNIKGAGGNGLLFVSGSGNVGIGTTSPGALLDVNGLFRFQQDIRVNNGTDKLILSATSTTTELHSAGTTGIVFKNSGNSDMVRFDAATGNVGIGTTSPATRLHVYSAGGGFEFGVGSSNCYIETIDRASVSKDLNTGYYTRGTGSFTWNNAAYTERMRIDGSGSVLIGVNGAYNSSRLLQVKDGLLIGNSFYTFASIDTNGTADLILSSNANPANLGSNSNIIFKLGTSAGGGPEERMRIVSDGNVGIGTTSPTGSLQVNKASQTLGATTPSGATIISNLADHNGILELGVDTTNLAYIQSRNITDQTYYKLLLNPSGGSVGIGTTVPAYLLDVSGSSRHGYRAVDTHQFTGSVSVSGSVTAASFTGSLSGSITSALTASYLTPANSYTITNLTASNISASLTGSFGIVGIGTASPGYTLEVNGTQRVVGNFYLFNTVVNPASNFSNQRGVGFEASTGKLEVAASGSDALSIGRFGSTGQILDFRYAGTQIGNFSLDTNDLTLATARHLILSPSGNVGIGTTDPGRKLHLYAAQSVIKLSNTSLGAWSGLDWSVGTGSYTAYSGLLDADGRYFIDVGSNGEDFTILQNGNVGIGITSPSYNLSISGSAGLQGNEEYLYFHSNYSVGNNARGKIRVVGAGGGSGYGGDLRFSTRKPTNVWNEDALTIDSSGNVGIGTSSPAVNLEVVGASETLGTIRISGGKVNVLAVGEINSALEFAQRDASIAGLVSGKIASISEFSNGAYAGLGFYTAQQSRVPELKEAVRITNNGDVGIGTTAPAAKLEISGSSNSVLLNIMSAISGAILYVSGSGAVGIGTSNVGAYTLQVNGSFAATTKSFVIEHPTKAGKKLIYGSLESPYHGIRLTGRDTLKEGKCKIQLPDYMYKLILHDSVNIQLTGIKCNKTLYIDDINVPENYFTIAYDKAIFESYKDYDFFWDFTAIRADVHELQTEM